MAPPDVYPTSELAYAELETVCVHCNSSAKLARADARMTHFDACLSLERVTLRYWRQVNRLATAYLTLNVACVFQQIRTAFHAKLLEVQQANPEISELTPLQKRRAARRALAAKYDAHASEFPYAQLVATKAHHNMLDYPLHFLGATRGRIEHHELTDASCIHCGQVVPVEMAHRAQFEKRYPCCARARRRQAEGFCSHLTACIADHANQAADPTHRVRLSALTTTVQAQIVSRRTSRSPTLSLALTQPMSDVSSTVTAFETMFDCKKTHGQSTHVYLIVDGTAHMRSQHLTLQSAVEHALYVGKGTLPDRMYKHSFFIRHVGSSHSKYSVFAEMLKTPNRELHVYILYQSRSGACAEAVETATIFALGRENLLNIKNGALHLFTAFSLTQIDEIGTSCLSTPRLYAYFFADASAKASFTVVNPV